MSKGKAKNGIEARVWSLHCKGNAPSKIDKMLELPAGEARSIVVRCWRMDWSIGTRVYFDA